MASAAPARDAVGHTVRMDDSLYLTRPGGHFLPTRLTQGPWAADRQHGGPVAALLAYLLETAAPPGWLTPQLTVDYLSAVPVAELATDVAVGKDGRRTRCVTASLSRDGRAVARARAWQVSPGWVPADALPEPATGAQTAGPGRTAAPPPLPGESSYGRASFRFGYQEAVEMRFVRGSFRERAPATAWARLLVPLLPDAVCSPLQQVAAVADFGSGISAVLDGAAWNFQNLDLSVHLHRQPADEWICLESASLVGPQGTGTCHTIMHDAGGPVGVAAQSLLITPAAPRP
jgi:Acyl-CoA thioesterase C-terminal domain/Acyl-CoA thioesterase N-terminal domain